MLTVIKNDFCATFFIFYSYQFFFNFQNALNSSKDESKKRSASTTTTPTTSGPPTQKSGTASVRVSICDRGTVPSTPTSEVESKTPTYGHVETKTPTHGQFQQVQCKLSDNGPTTTVLPSNSDLRNSRENVLPILSRRSSRENNGMSEDRCSISSVTGRAVRPDWAHPSVSVVESVNVVQTDLPAAKDSTVAATVAAVSYSKQPSLERRTSEERTTTTILPSKPCNNGSINISSRVDIHNSAAAAAATASKTSHTKASPQNSSSSSSPTTATATANASTTRRFSASSTTANSSSPMATDTTTNLGHPEPCV